MTAPQGMMDLETFEEIALILNDYDVKIRGMYTTGEPLLDPTLFEKYRVGRDLGVMAPWVSLNTNVSLLTPEKWQPLLDHTDNIALSFWNVGKHYDALTGLSWMRSYNNAIEFIKYRDRVRPDYRILISCNTVRGSNLAAVQHAFQHYDVTYEIDAALRWDGAYIEGPIDRAIMHPTFKCDGHEGVLMIKWNGDIEACSYDFTMETRYANILHDAWSDIADTFRHYWNAPFPLCRRCDYFHLYWKVKRNNFQPVHDESWKHPLHQGDDQ
jgi:sulfatase maturation enzyme AslB (radical SAM superfamily)